MSSRSAPMPPGATVTDKGDLPDILLEVCTRTDLADCFTHVNERGARVADFQISLAAVLVAQSCNIGFEPTIRSDIPALRRDRLSWVSQKFIRNETLRAANAKLVASHDALPIVRLWGSGDVASADGVRSPPRPARLSRSTRRAHRRLPERARRKTRRSRPHAQRDCLLERHLHASRRIFLRFEKLDVVFLGFIVFALIIDALQSC